MRGASVFHIHGLARRGVGKLSYRRKKGLAYCDSDDVKMIISTSLADASITELVAIADADIDDKLGGATLSTALLKKCSMMLTAAMIAEGNPKNYTVGEAKVDMGNRAKSWRAEAELTISRAKATIRTTVKSSSYEHIDEDARYVNS